MLPLPFNPLTMTAYELSQLLTAGKDNIATDPSLGMDTTAGSTAFVGSKPKKSADLVERLLEAGMIIIGKANLSELSYYKGKELLCGWSAVGGQGQSAYVRGGIDPEDTFAGHSNPGGSSSGSGISVSAGLAPLSIGTETQGSLILPSARAALYTIKPTIGLVSGQGIVPVCTVFDSAGPMTKSVMDEALLLEALMNDSAKSKISNRTQGGLGDVVQGANWENLKVGVLDPVKWKWSDKYLKPNKQNEDQMNAAYASAYAKIKTLAKSFHENLPLPNGDDMKIGDEGAIDTVISESVIISQNLSGIALAVAERSGSHTGLISVRNINSNLLDSDYQLLEDFQTYTSGLAHNPNNIHTIADIVEYNKRNAAVELPAEYPNQEKLEDVLKVNISKEYFEEALALLRKVSRDDGIDKMMKDYDIDVIIGPAESWMTGMASASAPLDLSPKMRTIYRPLCSYTRAVSEQSCTSRLIAKSPWVKALYSTTARDDVIQTERIEAPHTGSILILSLNNPKTRNAISNALLSSLSSHVKSIHDEGPTGPTRCLIIASALDNAFCAGADLKERKTFTAEETASFLGSLRATLSSIEALPIPTISAISSVALGGGLELALSTKLRVMTAGARVGLPETRLGIIPGAGGTYRLPRLIGKSRALSMMLTGRQISGQEAYDIGLASFLATGKGDDALGIEGAVGGVARTQMQARPVDTHDRESALYTAIQVSKAISQGGPLAIRAVMRAVEGASEKSENEAYDSLLDTEDRVEALRAFGEKRKAKFTGR
ncbi:hypothetical protein MMC25_005102 [Agyrium rufum]|nr:hypothetical protein [Agyrium rufum]